MTRRPAAPDSALTVRAVVGLTIPLIYIVFRLPELASAWEAAVTWVGAAACIGIAISSVEELGIRRFYRAERIRSIRNAVTESIAPVRVWPDATELGIAKARHAAMAPLIDRGEIVEPRLFTHEFQPLTPPHGTPLPATSTDEETAPYGVLMGDTADSIAYTTSEYVGRHRLADAQLTRERAWHVFGEL